MLSILILARVRLTGFLIYVFPTYPATIDYRKVPRALSKVYYDPINEENRRELDKIFHARAGDQPIEENRSIAIWGRNLYVPESSTAGVARFTFDDLCGKPLSAADYLEITETFGTVFVTDVPKMGLDSKDKVNKRPIAHIYDVVESIF